MPGKDKWEKKRLKLVKYLKGAGHVTSPEVEQALLDVPRHIFVPGLHRRLAYSDQPLSIGHKQTISAPHMVAMMAEKLDLTEGMNVLEVGGGPGYHAAVISRLIGEKGHIYSIEIVPALVKMAQNSIKEAGYSDRVTMLLADGSIGYPDKAPYDRIFVACAAPDLPPPLVEQLKIGGKMIIPIENGMGYQDLIVYNKTKDGLQSRNDGGCVFVPLIGKWGY